MIVSTGVPAVPAFAFKGVNTVHRCPEHKPNTFFVPLWSIAPHETCPDCHPGA